VYGIVKVFVPSCLNWGPRDRNQRGGGGEGEKGGLSSSDHDGPLGLVKRVQSETEENAIKQVQRSYCPYPLECNSEENMSTAKKVKKLKKGKLPFENRLIPGEGEMEPALTREEYE